MSIAAIPIITSAALWVFLASDVPPTWQDALLQYGVCGIWIIWFHFALKAQIKRDDIRHDDNQKMMRQHTEGLATINLLLVTVLEEMKEFSPRSIGKIVDHAREQAVEAIRESRDKEKPS